MVKKLTRQQMHELIKLIRKEGEEGFVCNSCLNCDEMVKHKSGQPTSGWKYCPWCGKEINKCASKS